MKPTAILCGRKHCTVCKRWRHSADFSTTKWLDEPHCTIPRYLASRCRTCARLQDRTRKRSKPRRVGIDISQRRKRQHKYRNRKKYQDYHREYNRFYRSAKRAEKADTGDEEYFG